LEREKAEKTMYVCCQLVRSLSILFSPIIPYSTAYLQSLIGEEIATGEDSLLTNIWETAALPLLNSGAELRKPEILFNRVEDDFVEAERAKLGGDVA
jgi:methionyl-tRNA synthetase